MTPQQRFCPICDRALIDGEAVLRCSGCGVLHHPACWVKNDGCATHSPHEMVPMAVAYATSRYGETREGSRGPDEGPSAQAAQRPLIRNEPVIGSAAGEPVIGSAAPPPLIDDLANESTAPEPGGPESVPVRPPAPQHGAGPVPVVPESPPASAEWPSPARKRPPAPYVVREPGEQPRSPRPAAEGGVARKPLPNIYGRHRLLQFWFIPAAALLALAVAVAIIFLAEALFGGDDEKPAAVVSTPTPVPPSPTAAAQASPGPSAAATAAAPQAKFKAGDAVVVTGAGSGKDDCLNIRVGPARTSDAIVCVPDGTEMTIRGGPESGGDLRWWKVQTPQGEGWAAEDYLSRKP